MILGLLRALWRPPLRRAPLPQRRTLCLPPYVLLQDPNLVNQSDPYYLDLRARANKEGDAMARAFDESHRAYTSGNGARAKELSNEGKAHQRQMEEFNKKAADWIFVGAWLVLMGVDSSAHDAFQRITRWASSCCRAR